MSNFNKNNLIFLTINFFIAIIIYSYYYLGCFSSCSLEQTVGYLRPALFIFTSLLLFGLIFLFFPSYYFKKWLIYIASWYLPLTVILLSQISIYSSNILSMDRGPAALWLMAILGFITIVYILILKKRSKLSH